MSEENEARDRKAAEEAYKIVLEKIQSGHDQDTIIQEMVDAGIDAEVATSWVTAIYEEVGDAARAQAFSPFAILPAILGGIIAALIGGAAWALITISTGYELGFIAWAIGLLSGYAVLLFSQGRRGTFLQLTAVVSSILGIAAGKYATFYYYSKKSVEEQLGAEAAGELSVLSGELVNLFVEQQSAALGIYDIVFVVLAVITAWRIPKSLEISVPPLEAAADAAYCTGGPGDSPDTAVIVHATSTEKGTPAEYAYVEAQCGKPGTDWMLETQSQSSHEGKEYDVLQVKSLKDGSSRTFWFDISSFFGKL